MFQEGSFEKTSLSVGVETILPWLDRITADQRNRELLAGIMPSLVHGARESWRAGISNTTKETLRWT